MHVVERLRQRVQPAPVNLTAPMWVDDTNFDLRYHVRHIALPKPGTMRQLLDLASLIACDPFDRTRPLWQFVSRRRAAWRQVGADPEAAPHDHRRRGRRASCRCSSSTSNATRPNRRRIDPAQLADRDPRTGRSNSDLLRDLLAGSLRMPLGLLRQIRDLLADPTGIPEAGAAAADTVRGVMSQLSDTEPARSPLWTERSLQRQMEVLRAPFDETKAAAKRLGGTLNTAFLTAAAEAAGRYHERDGLARRGAAGEHGHQHPHRGLRVECLLAGPDAGADRRHADRRALRLDPGRRRRGPRLQLDGIARDARRGGIDACRRR